MSKAIGTKARGQEIAVIGLGKLGLPLAAAIAARGYKVRGFDQNASRRNILLDHSLITQELLAEKDLEETLRKQEANLIIESSATEAARSAEFIFLVLPTPSLKDGSFSLEYVMAACDEVSAALADTESDPTIVLVSTVSPGSIVDKLIPRLEHTTNLVCGEGFHFCYSPALVALGDVIKGFLEPDLAFVGEVDPTGADRLEEFYRELLVSNTPLYRMSAQSVEIAKLALNNFLTTKIGFANMVGQLAQKTQGANAYDILAAVGRDSRVGHRFLQHGLSYGGPCLPRDTSALTASLEAADIPSDFPTTVEKLNVDHSDRLAALAGGANSAAVLGLGYKPGSPHATDSGAIALCNSLHRLGIEVSAFDRHAEQMDLGQLETGVKTSSKLNNVLNGSEYVFPLFVPQQASLWVSKLTEDQTVVVVDGKALQYPCAANIIFFGQGPE